MTSRTRTAIVSRYSWMWCAGLRKIFSKLLEDLSRWGMDVTCIAAATTGGILGVVCRAYINFSDSVHASLGEHGPLWHEHFIKSQLLSLVSTIKKNLKARVSD